MEKQALKFYIGIDEVGRGPIAGPVTVCALLSCVGRSPREFDGIKDSKQLTEKGRERWYKKIRETRENKIINFSIISVSNKVIDKIGIVPAINLCVKNCLDKLQADPEETSVLLDGSLYAPKIYENQETIIKGDEKEPLIAMASIVAKISRDWYMKNEVAQKFPQYSFEKHKGYGTKQHYQAIKEHGISEIHRRSFLK